MTADPAEAMFFDGAPVAHVVEFRERQRIARRLEADRAAIRHATGIRLRGGAVSWS